MPPQRQWYCWLTIVQYQCGCKEETERRHVCDPWRENCNAWDNRIYPKMECKVHRVRGLGDGEGGGEQKEEDGQQQQVQ